MTRKPDYCQSGRRIIVNKPDEHIEVWWNTMDQDGNVFPVELQMSLKGCRDLINELKDAYMTLMEYVEFERSI